MVWINIEFSEYSLWIKQRITNKFLWLKKLKYYSTIIILKWFFDVIYLICISKFPNLRKWKHVTKKYQKLCCYYKQINYNFNKLMFNIFSPQLLSLAPSHISSLYLPHIFHLKSHSYISITPSDSPSPLASTPDFWRLSLSSVESSISSDESSLFRANHLSLCESLIFSSPLAALPPLQLDYSLPLLPLSSGGPMNDFYLGQTMYLKKDVTSGV